MTAAPRDPEGLQYKFAGTVKLSGRVSRMQAIGKGHSESIPNQCCRFPPDSECLSPGGSVLGRSDVIAAEMVQVLI